MYTRALSDSLQDALADTPAVLIVGAREVGKSTLIRSVLRPPWKHITLDDAGPLAGALADPPAFLSGYESVPLAIDEIQKAPALLPAIKASIDRNRSPGRFVLAGSANVLTLPAVSESLAGRMQVMNLWPLSQREIEGRSGAPTWVRALFEGQSIAGAEGSSNWRSRAYAGGYPEVLARRRSERRDAWFESYLATLLHRDACDVSAVADTAALVRLLRVLGTRGGALLNVADLSRSIAVPASTVRRYLAILEALLFGVRAARVARESRRFCLACPSPRHAGKTSPALTMEPCSKGS